jgi:hypothetical protein
MGWADTAATGKIGNATVARLHTVATRQQIWLAAGLLLLHAASTRAMKMKGWRRTAPGSSALVCRKCTSVHLSRLATDCLHTLPACRWTQYQPLPGMHCALLRLASRLAYKSGAMHCIWGDSRCAAAARWQVFIWQFMCGCLRLQRNHSMHGMQPHHSDAKLGHGPCTSTPQGRPRAAEAVHTR